jgi:hypothetical protein
MYQSLQLQSPQKKKCPSKTATHQPREQIQWFRPRWSTSHYKTSKESKALRQTLSDRELSTGSTPGGSESSKHPLTIPFISNDVPSIFGDHFLLPDRSGVQTSCCKKRRGPSTGSQWSFPTKKWKPKFTDLTSSQVRDTPFKMNLFCRVNRRNHRN